MTDETSRTARIAALHEAAAKRILVLDGAWGAKIQELGLTEEQFRGERFANHGLALRGNTDLLCLTRPNVVSELLDGYLEAGADITSTNTFNHPNWATNGPSAPSGQSGGLNLNPTSSQFGEVTQKSVGNPRQLQLALRYYF